MPDMCTLNCDRHVLKTPLSKGLLQRIVANTCDEFEGDVVAFQRNCPSLFYDGKWQDPVLDLLLCHALLPASKRLCSHQAVTQSISSLKHTAKVADTYLTDLRFLRTLYENYHVHERIGYEEFCFELRDHCRTTLPRLTGTYLYNDHLRETYMYAFNEFLLQKRSAPAVC